LSCDNEFSSPTGGSSQPSATALADIPANYLALYRAAAGVCPGLDWPILAAIGKIETDHGRSTLPGVSSGENAAHAAGPMQFLQPSCGGVLARHQLPPGGAAPPSRYNTHDAIYAAAFYLCDNGVSRGDVRAAIFSYNHANWYVQEVLDQAKKYSQQTLNVSAACDTFQQTVQQRAADFSAGRAMVAAQFACAQLGKPYVWGGNGDPGFDCSGLTRPPMPLLASRYRGSLKISSTRARRYWVSRCYLVTWCSLAPAQAPSRMWESSSRRQR
jgi:cell wall-associated NlpC family hydrolase